MKIIDKYLVSYKIIYNDNLDDLNEFIGVQLLSEEPTYQESINYIKDEYKNLKNINIIILGISKVKYESEE